MKISYSWLKQYAEFKESPEVLSELLTGCGLEVEGLEKYETVKGGLEGVVVGNVVSKEKHPNADKLSLTKVDIGSAEMLSIVCGATNVAAGQKVLVATIGTTIYSEKGDFVIQKSKIRGELSEGMICAEDELGLGSSHDGILVLPEEAFIGTLAKDYLKIETDYVFEIGLTPNRSDATSHIGVARDANAVLNNINTSNNCISLPSVDDFKQDNNNLKIDVILEDSMACPRYSGLTLSGITVEESPAWLKNRLNAIGIRTINNIVDISNYVLFETGQPLHIFDAEKISGGKVIVKKLPKGTKFTTLDEAERVLTGEDLMICNDNEGMCIAGVFGGAKSGVNSGTKNIFIESAYFDPTTIRKTSKYFNLKTDASFRFERGCDPNITVYALKRAALLIKEIAGGEISSEIIDVYPEKIENRIVELSYQYLNTICGNDIEKEKVKIILKSIDIMIINESEEGLVLSIPTNKTDVTRDIDVVEEVLRIYGYNNIEFTSSFKMSINYAAKPDRERLQNLTADYLSNNGFYEMMNNSLTQSQYYENNTDIFEEAKCVKLLNPLSKELDVMRQTLIFGGLESISHNLNRKASNLKFYEFGNTYKRNITEKTDVIAKFAHNYQLALFLTGNKTLESWNVKEDKIDFYYLKNIAENIIKRIGIDRKSIALSESTSALVNSGISYIFRNKALCEIGSVNSKILKQFDIKAEVFYASFDWDIVYNAIKNNEILFSDLPKFPEVRRDLALLIDSGIKFSQLESLAFNTEKKLLKNVNLFDVYQGDKIESGKKSYALSFILQDDNKTLTDKEIDKTMNKLIDVYSKELNANIR
jgi:phenylalanyl-tRNA synthetase beta chain